MTIEIIKRLINRSKEYERKMRLMERRMKEIEKETNSISLIQPPLEDIMIGDYVNCEFRNMVDENNPTAVNPDDGSFEFDFGPPSKQKHCYLKFFHTVQCSAFNIEFETIPSLGFTIVAGDDFTGSGVDMTIGTVLSDWVASGSGAISWDNKPSISNAEIIQFAHGNTSGGGGPGSYTDTYQSARVMYLRIPANPLTYGIAISVTGTVANRTLDFTGLVQGVCQIQGAENEIFVGNSSFGFSG